MAAVVQSAKNSGTGTSVTVTLGSPTTPGNCLVNPDPYVGHQRQPGGQRDHAWRQRGQLRQDRLRRQQRRPRDRGVLGRPGLRRGQTSVVVTMASVGGSKGTSVTVYEVSGMPSTLTGMLDKSAVFTSSGFVSSWTLRGGSHDSLAVLIAQQEGKSTLVARRFPEWLLVDRPELRIAIVSYESETALRWGRDIKLDIEVAGTDLPISIREDSSAAGRWETPQGGGVYCVGVGGALSGRAVDCVCGDIEIVAESGYAWIRDIHHAADKPSVLSYNHATGRAEWKQVTASRAIPGRRLVEVVTASGRRFTCTPDQGVHTVDRAYVTAADLRPGERLVAADGGPGAVRGMRDRVHQGPIDDLAGTARQAAVLQPAMPIRRSLRLADLRAVRQAVHEAPVRGAESAEGRVHPLVLLTAMLRGGRIGNARRSAPMRYLRPAAADASVPLLFPGLPATRGGANGHSGLLALRRGVRVAAVRGRQEDEEGADGPVVLAGMRHGMADIAAASEAAT